MPPRFDKEAHDGLLAERLGSLKPVQGLNEYEACPSALTKIGACRPLSRMLNAISSTRFCLRVERRLTGT